MYVCVFFTYFILFLSTMGIAQAARRLLGPLQALIRFCIMLLLMAMVKFPPTRWILLKYKGDTKSNKDHLMNLASLHFLKISAKQLLIGFRYLTLKKGDKPVDVTVFKLEDRSEAHLLDFAMYRPLVVNFGSCT